MNSSRFTHVATVAAALVVALGGAIVAPEAHAGARSTVSIVNQSSHTVVSIVSSPTYRDEYGDIDVLGPRTMLRPGYRVAVDFDTADAENECVQDVMALASNGTRWKKRMNVCKETTWTLGN